MERGKGNRRLEGLPFFRCSFSIVVAVVVFVRFEVLCQTSRTGLFLLKLFDARATQYKMGIIQKLSMLQCWCRLRVYNFPFFHFHFHSTAMECMHSTHFSIFSVTTYDPARARKKNALRMLKIVKCKCFSIQMWL